MNNPRFCSECGSRIPENENFCPECGTRYHHSTNQDVSDEDGHALSANPMKGLDASEGNTKMDPQLRLLIIMSCVTGFLILLFIWFFFLKDSDGSISWDSTPSEMVDENYERDKREAMTSEEERQVQIEEEVAPDEELADEYLTEGEEETSDESAAEEETPANRSEKHFSGTVNGNPVRMTINASTGNGYYTITKDGVSQTVRLSCRVTPDGYIYVNEYTPDGEYSGEWEGTFRNGVFSGQGIFQGSSASFSLREIR